MLGTALYYPHIDIDDGGWLRSAVLFWDQVQTIVPTSIKKPYTNSDTEICQQEGYHCGVICIKTFSKNLGSAFSSFWREIEGASQRMKSKMRPLTL